MPLLEISLSFSFLGRKGCRQREGHRGRPACQGDRDRLLRRVDGGGDRASHHGARSQRSISADVAHADLVRPPETKRRNKKKKVKMKRAGNTIVGQEREMASSFFILLLLLFLLLP